MRQSYFFLIRRGALLATCLAVCGVADAVAQPPATDKGQQPADQAADQVADEADQKKDEDRGDSNLVRLSKTDEVWIDVKAKRVILGGTVCLREGQLEMFACPKNTKEHESVVSVNISSATLVHAGLLAVGAKVGHPVKFEPDYLPATGTRIDIDVQWTDADGKQHSLPAQQWIKHLQSGKPMPYHWVFAGSAFWTDELTGERFYYANGGELICLSNFSTAMLDIPVESSQSNEGLLFSAFTDHIPPLGTPVKLILKPVLKEKTADDPPKKDN